VSPKTTRWLLFAAALLAAPIPFYLGEPELAPLLRLAFLSALVTSVFAVEGGATAGALAGIALAQVVVWGGLLFLAAAGVTRGLARIATDRARAAMTAALAIGLLGASLSDIYDTPLSSTRARSNLFHLFE